MVHAFARAAALSVALLPVAAFAASPGAVTADLNMRQGPGSNYGVVATLPAGSAVSIVGCIQSGNWCEVEAGGQQGYVFARYLTAESDGTTVTVSERPGIVGIVTAPVTIAAGATGAIVGTLTGAETTSVSGGNAVSFQSPPEVIDYVRNNPPGGNPIYLDGEAVPGARVPSEVPLSDVPDTAYQYANINGERVIVAKDTRQVVYVVR